MTETPASSQSIPAPFIPSPVLAFAPTYAPETEAITDACVSRPLTRLTNEEIAARIARLGYMSRVRPWMYMDAIDSCLNVRPDIDLVVGDARSTDSIRALLRQHQEASSQSIPAAPIQALTPYPANRGYDLVLYPERMSQWRVLNHVWKTFGTPATKYFIYTSSDIIWTMDWIAPAIAHFERDPALQILFPCVNSGDPALPCQISRGPAPVGTPLIEPPYQEAARAPVLNGYAFIMRAEFLRTYGGYPTAYRNCFSESYLHYMCEAMGGKMRLMPEGYCYHHGSGDAWTGEGGSYHYEAEKPTFDKMMDEVQAARANGTCTVDFLRKLLYV